MILVEQAAPLGVSAWLAAVGLAHLSVMPDRLDDDYRPVPRQSYPSRWVKAGVDWYLEIEQAADFAALRRWYADRFAEVDPDVYEDEPGARIPVEVVARDPWWRTRGAATVHGLGEAIWREIRGLKGVDLVDELRVRARARRTSKLAGWVLDRQWVDMDPEVQDTRPLIRYALAYVGATVAQHWPGHMAGASAVGHLWDGQPGDHPISEHHAIIWPPAPEQGAAAGRYPAWWGPGQYATIPAAQWPMLVREHWTDQWLHSELIGRTTAKAITEGNLPEPLMSRSRVPLWRRSVLTGGGYTSPAPSEEESPWANMPPSMAARVPGDRPLDVHGVADMTSLAVATIRAYIRDDVMPEPDGRMGQSAWWWSSTIGHWQATRPTSGRPVSTGGRQA